MSYDALATHLQGRFSRNNATGDADRPARKDLSRRLTAAFVLLVEAASPDMVVEVGAHEGAFSRKVKRLLPDATVVAFEANPDVFEKYREGLVGKGIDYRHCCIADRAGTIEFKIPIRHGNPVLTMGSMLPDTIAHGFIDYEVQAVPLDDVVDVAERLALWVDVEGAAGIVLQGGGKALDRCIAAHVEVETRERWQHQAVDTQIIETFAEHGLVPVIRDAQRDWQYNIVFAREESHDETIVREFVAYAMDL